jgi:IS4 transposase
VAYVQTQIAGSDEWTKSRRDELARKLRTTPALWRLVRRLGGGRYRIDKAAIAREEKLDGKWLLRTSDDSLTPTDLALAYKQLLEVERGWRDLKGSLGLRPVFHHREDRIRSHVQLYWLVLLLIRVVENATGDSWRNVRHELDRMHIVTMQSSEGRVAQRTNTTPAQASILRFLEMADPGRFLDFELPT